MFNGIGRVFASNSEYFTPVGHLALTIGGIWAATRAIFRGNIGIFAMELVLSIDIYFYAIICSQIYCLAQG
ncbi:hypothetical protein ACA348_05620 [Orientia tsutsugamushi]|uniref:hypothetical protein n=1 Tax=Orientia tsutsugamushi TaxID=784 RepID=UPI003527BEC4